MNHLIKLSIMMSPTKVLILVGAHLTLIITPIWMRPKMTATISSGCFHSSSVNLIMLSMFLFLIMIDVIYLATNRCLETRKREINMPCKPRVITLLIMALYAGIQRLDPMEKAQNPKTSR